MRRGFGLIRLVVTAIVLVIVGAIAYNIGWSDGAATHLPAATNAEGAPYYYYGPHYFGGGAIFGLFWFLLIVFGLFWLFRIAFFGLFARRMWGGGGWGYGRGWGNGPRSFEERAQEWHRRQHEQQPPTRQAPGQTPPPPPDTRNV